MKRIISKIKAAFRQLYYLVFLPVGNVIVFESIPDLSDNTRAVFDEMLKRNMNQKYKLVWSISGSSKCYDKIHNVIYLNRNDENEKKLLDKYLLKAKAIVCCNIFYPTKRLGQKSFYLSHGTTFKSVHDYYTVPARIDYCLISSAAQQVIDFQSYELNFDKSKAMPLGFPRNDVLTEPTIDVKKPLGTECEKIIVWYPTYRQHKSADLHSESKNALPIIYDATSARALNDVAKDNNTLIVLKPHFAQDVSYIKDLNLSNVRFIDDSFFVKNNITSYQFVAACDALVTDYSSIYFDFTLCNKPVAAVWEDIEDYKKNPGLIENYEYYMKGAEKIYTIEDFTAFIQHVAEGIDILKEERVEIRDIVNYSTDGKNSERVVDFIIEKAGL